MTISSKLLHIFLGILASIATGGQCPVGAIPENQWLTKWLIAGPISMKAPKNGQTKGHLPGFNIDYLTVQGGEANIIARETDVFMVDKKKYTWELYQSADSVIDLDRLFPNNNYSLAYAINEIDCTTPGLYLLSVGSDDGLQLWLNGKVVLDTDQMRGIIPDEDLVPVVLIKGKNIILVKTENYTHSWGFCLRVMPFDAAKILHHPHTFDILYGQGGLPLLRINYPKNVIDYTFKKAQIKISKAGYPESVVSDYEWTPSPSTLLEIKEDEYDEYRLYFTCTMGNNEIFTLKRSFAGGRREIYDLFAEGKTKYIIALDKEASESEKWAAKELQKKLKEISGAEFPIQTGLKGKKNQIALGYNLCSLLLGDSTLNKPDDQNESFTYRNKGSNVLIWGGRDRGTMYGVISFLENELGCRWYSPVVSLAPKKNVYEFVRLFRTEAPGVQVRNDFYFEAFNGEWAAHNRLNGFFSVPINLSGGGYGYWRVHTFYKLVPPSDYFQKHPEYFSLINGKREWNNSQLCLTNPEVLQIVVDGLINIIKVNPQYLIYCISQNDNLNACQCDKCQAIAKQEESESGPVIWFVNQVAERVGKEFPEKYVGTLAYQYSRKPCKNLKPRHNVVVRLCSIECCFSHPLDKCSQNQSFIEDLTEWATIAPHLYIWDYVVNFRHYMMPYPNFQVLQSNIQTFAKNKVIGIMEQGAYQSRGGEFAELRAYMIAKLLWNPNANIDDIVNDFMYGYYGRSGQYVRQYYDLLAAQVTQNTHIGLLIDTDNPIYTDEFISEGEEIFDHAESVAGSEEVRHRVELARLPLMYLKFRRRPNLCQYDGTLEHLKEIIAREGITHYSEIGIIQKDTFKP